MFINTSAILVVDALCCFEGDIYIARIAFRGIKFKVPKFKQPTPAIEVVTSRVLMLVDLIQRRNVVSNRNWKSLELEDRNPLDSSHILIYF